MMADCPVDAAAGGVLPGYCRTMYLCAFGTELTASIFYPTTADNGWKAFTTAMQPAFPNRPNWQAINILLFVLNFPLDMVRPPFPI